MLSVISKRPWVLAVLLSVREASYETMETPVLTRRVSVVWVRAERVPLP